MFKGAEVCCCARYRCLYHNLSLLFGGWRAKRKCASRTGTSGTRATDEKSNICKCRAHYAPINIDLNYHFYYYCRLLGFLNMIIIIPGSGRERERERKGNGLCSAAAAEAEGARSSARRRRGCHSGPRSSLYSSSFYARACQTSLS